MGTQGLPMQITDASVAGVYHLAQAKVILDAGGLAYEWFLQNNGVSYSLKLTSGGKLMLNDTEVGKGGSGATTFTALTDTPNTFTAGKWLKVNALGTAIEQVDAPTAGSSVTVDTALSTTSENPVQNKVITAATGINTNLLTTHKTTLVGAINENKQKIGTLDNDQKTLKIFKHTNFGGF
jgi:hypothetical protein